jgi:dihydroorotate dehydrogenase
MKYFSNNNSLQKDLKELLVRDGVKNFTEIIGNKTLS